MKRGIILLFIFTFLALFNPVASSGNQWKFFEHRYKYELKDVLDASKFVKKDGYWEGYRDNRLVGYVLLSKRWTKKLVGYSGKHLETLIGMNTDGILTGVKVIFHSEPIVLIGLKEKNYKDFIKQYPGKDIRQDFRVGKEISMDAITGATVTAVVQNAIILGSARKVASITGMMKFSREPQRKISTEYRAYSWKELLRSGAVRNIKVTSKDLGMKGDDIYLDLYFGVVTPPSIGRNILGDGVYKDTISRLKKGETAIFVFSSGKGSFKGSGFARGGIFDRFNIEQEERVHVFRDSDYRILTDIKAEGAPAIKEGGIFILRRTDFDLTRPFKFNLVLTYRGERFKKRFKSFSADYRLPDIFLE
jgi:NosR/NirI family nitrous oxide reductase transcriptional regulator